MTEVFRNCNMRKCRRWENMAEGGVSSGLSENPSDGQAPETRFSNNDNSSDINGNIYENNALNVY